MALIITIIILILLAAISINAVLKAGIIDTATDAAIKYEKEQYREKEILDDLDNTIKDALNEIGENTGTKTNNKPVFASVPVGTAVANTNDQMIIEAVATDADENDILTYTLWFGTSETNLEKTNLTTEAKQGNTISFTQTGLSNDTRYYFKIVASDGKDETISEEVSVKTHCEGTYCSGGWYSDVTCTQCKGLKKTSCGVCSGQGQLSCLVCSGSGTVLIIGEKCSLCNGVGSFSNAVWNCMGTLTFTGNVVYSSTGQSRCYWCNFRTGWEAVAVCDRCDGYHRVAGDEECASAHVGEVLNGYRHNPTGRCRVCEGTRSSRHHF